MTINKKEIILLPFAWAYLPNLNIFIKIYKITWGLFGYKARSIFVVSLLGKTFYLTLLLFMKKFQNDKNIYEEISEWFIVDYNIFTFCNT